MAKNRPRKLKLPKSKGNLTYAEKARENTSSLRQHHTQFNDFVGKLDPIKKRWLFGISLAIIGLILLGASLLTYAASYEDKIYPNSYIGSLNLGGKTVKEAETILSQSISELPKEVTLAFSDKPATRIEKDKLGLTYNAAATAQNLYDKYHNRPWFKRLYGLVAARYKISHHNALYGLDDKKTEAFLKSATEKYSTPAVNAQIVLKDDNTVAVTPAKEGSGITYEILQSSLTREIGSLHLTVKVPSGTIKPAITEANTTEAVKQVQAIIAKTPLTFVTGDVKTPADTKKVFSWIKYRPAQKTKASRWQRLFVAHAQDTPQLVAELDIEQVKNFIANIAVNVDRDVKNAEIRMVDNKLTVIADHTDGQKLQLDESVNETTRLLISPEASPNLVITLPMKVVEAPIKSSTINNLGIKELIGRAETNFKGSPANRSHNITTGASFLNGEIIAPGQEFSTVKTLGKIDDSTGYLPELVIKENRTIPEYGGGLCQVSSTLFRSVLNAGLKVTERQNHSYRVAYYEPPVGLDATIYLPKPDFKFLNDTPSHILIQNRIEGTKISFELYGTRDGRTSSISDPIVSDLIEPPPPSYTETDTLNRGETKQIEKPHQGATAVVTYIVTRDGKEINKQVFRSKYKPWQARFLVGTKDPAPQPTPQP